jgi:hypothetical protein
MAAESNASMLENTNNTECTIYITSRCTWTIRGRPRKTVDDGGIGTALLLL